MNELLRRLQALEKKRSAVSKIRVVYKDSTIRICEPSECFILALAKECVVDRFENIDGSHIDGLLNALIAEDG